ncbi:MAG: DUF2087 domain-containing protein [Leptolyngbyaceae cyanobacterium]
MDLKSKLTNYLDVQGRLKAWPSRRNRRQFQRWALEYLIEKFKQDLLYSEKQVNEILNQHHTFGDPALLRREMFERKLMNRTRDGAAYWRQTQ